MSALGHLPDTRQTQFKKVNLFAYVFLWSQKPLMPQMILKASRLNGRKGLVRYWNIEVPGNYSGFQVRRDIEMLNSKRWEEIVSFSPGLGQVCWQEWICQLPPNSFWLPKLSGKGGRNRGHQGTSYYLYQTWGILTIQVKGSVSCVYSWLSNSLCNIWSIGHLRHWRSKPIFNYESFLPLSKDSCLFNYFPDSRNQVVWKFGQGTYGAMPLGGVGRG